MQLLIRLRKFGVYSNGFMPDNFSPKPIRTTQLLHVVEDYVMYSLSIKTRCPLSTIPGGWDGHDGPEKAETILWTECTLGHTRTEQEDHVQATMWISCVHKIRIPKVGLKDFSSPALRHGFLTQLVNMVFGVHLQKVP